jgi:hypothetical protein
MNTSSPRRNFLFSAICALGLMLLPFASVTAADKAPALPVSHSFTKAESHEGTPFVLHVKNDSKDTLKIEGKVLLAVVNHAMDKARVLPEQTLKAGESMTVTGLAGDDKVVLSAHGYETLTIAVPFKL